MRPPSPGSRAGTVVHENRRRPTTPVRTVSVKGAAVSTPSSPSRPVGRDALSWTAFGVALLAVVVVAWACVTAWDAVVHGHPAYAVWLGAVIVVAGTGVWWTVRPRRRRKGVGARIGRGVLVALALGAVGLTAWLRPYVAVDPALAAMASDADVTVSESATDIVLAPTSPDATGILFRPGALVDPRAYAAVLRPIAEAGHTVVIAKQPFGLAMLAPGALPSARAGFPSIERWIVGGHSLGGTFAAVDASGGDRSGVRGLLLFASYPAGDLSGLTDVAVASISGTEDGLATPVEIDASRANLPASSTFVVVDGASHAQFGDYGPQPGDGTPTLSDDDARRQISEAALAFIADVTR